MSVWLRYTDGHAVGKYCVYDTYSRKVIFTHNVRFIRNYFVGWITKDEEPLVTATPKINIG